MKIADLDKDLDLLKFPVDEKARLKTIARCLEVAVIHTNNIDEAFQILSNRTKDSTHIWIYRGGSHLALMYKGFTDSVRFAILV